MGTSRGRIAPSPVTNVAADSLRLGDQEAIQGVAMVHREVLHGGGVQVLDDEAVVHEGAHPTS
jgi:hypothetical protein